MGSQLLFVLLRRFHLRLPAVAQGTRFEVIGKGFERRGLVYLIGLRAVGAPHLLVTTASAVLPIRGPQFAVATAAGMLPAVFIPAGACLLL